MQGRSPLLVAAHEGSLLMAKLLVERGCNVQLADARGWTALLAALSEGHRDMAQLLLSAGASCAIRTHSGTSALLFACVHNVLVPELLRRGAGLHINTPDQLGQRPLMVAAARWPVLVPLLLQHGADPGATDAEFERSAVYMAAGSTDPAAVAAVERLLDEGAELAGR